MEPSILQVLLMFLLIAEISGGEVSSFHYYNPTFANCHTNRMHSCVNGECTYIGFKPFYGELYPVYKCMCPDGWLGDRCDFEDMCPQHGYWLCLNGATCSRNQCHCAASFYGRRCEHRLDHCAEHACQAYSTCVNEPTGYRCECPANRIGTYCEHFHPCYGSNNKCQNDATCVSDTKTGEYQCICKAGFEGDHCEVNLDKCATYSLCIMGTCVNEPRGSFTCHCQPGYIGRRCDQELRPCQPWPCQNGGYCFNRLLTYECRCPAGFGGTNCEIDQRTTSAVEQDNCRWSSNGLTHCQNGARCVNYDGGFECICTRGFAGRLCEDSVAVIEEELSGSSLDNALTDESSVESTLSSTTESPTTEKESSFAEAELTTSTFASNFTDVLLDSETVEVVTMMNNTTEGALSDSNSGIATTPASIEDISESITTNNLIHSTSVTLKTVTADFSSEVPSRDDSLPSTAVPDSASTMVTTVLPNRYAACGSNAERCFRAFADGRCDEICNTEACLYDGFDCASPSSPQCARLHYCSRHYADGRCDAECDAVECGWDGGDCDEVSNGTSGSGTSSVILNGELVLVIAASKEHFFRHLTDFMVALSGRLRASLRVAVDSRGRAEIYCIQRNGVEAENGAGESTTRLIDLPNSWDAEALRVIYHASGFVGLSESFPSHEDVLALHLSADDSAIKVVFHLDVAACKTRQQHQRDFECFSQIESVAEFVSVASGKNLIHAELPVLEASAQMSKESRSYANGVPPAVVGALAAFTLLIMLLMMVSRNVLYAKKRKVYAKAQWNPPVLKKSSDSCINTAGFETSVAPSDNIQHSFYSSNVANFETGLPHGWASSAASLCHSGFSSNNIVPVSLNASSINSFNNAISVDHLPYRQFNIDSGLQMVGEQKNVPSNDLQSGFGGAEAIADSRLVETERLALHILAETPGGINSETPVDRRLINEPGLYLRRTPLLTLFTPLPFRRTDADLIEAANRLIYCGANINAQDKHQSTALILAIKQRRVEVVRRLLQWGADPNLSDICEHHPLYHAVQARSPAIVALLLADLRIDVDASNGRRETALMCCARLGGDSSLECARLLIDCGKADVNAIGDPIYPECERRSALNYAASYNNVPMIHLLVNRGADQNAMDDRKLTPLTAAAYNGHMEAVEALLMLGAKQHFEDELSAPYEHRIIRESYPHIAAQLKEAKARCLTQLHVSSTTHTKTTKKEDCGSSASKKRKAINDILTTDCQKSSSLSNTLLTPPLSNKSLDTSPLDTSSSLSPQQATTVATAVTTTGLLTNDTNLYPAMRSCNGGSTMTRMVLNPVGLASNNCGDVGTVDARLGGNNFGNNRQQSYDCVFYQQQQQQYAQQYQQHMQYNNYNNFVTVAEPQINETEQHSIGYPHHHQQQRVQLHQSYNGTPYAVQQSNSFTDTEQHQLSNQHMTQLQYEQQQRYVGNMENVTLIQQRQQQPMPIYHQYPNHYQSTVSLPNQWY